MLTFIITSCEKNENTTIITPDKLPESSIAFISEYFPSVDIKEANKYIVDNPNINEYIYSAKLSDETLVYFDNDGEWYNIDALNGLNDAGKEIIFDKLPRYVGIKDEFNSYYAKQKITQLSKIQDDELSFVLDNKYQSYIIDTHEGWTYADGYSHDRYEIPANIMDLITGKSTKDIGPMPILLRFTGHRGHIYRFIDIDKTYIDFYENGEWFYITNKIGSKINNSRFISEVPEEIRKTLTDNFSNAANTIMTITRYNNSSIYAFEFGEKKFAAISKDNKIIETPFDKAKEYIENGFNPKEELAYIVRLNTGGAYHLRHAFIAKSEYTTISLVTDYEGNMRTISAGPITSNKDETVALPENVLNDMPKAALDYVNEHYPDSPIIQISYNYSQNQDDVSDQFYFTVSVPQNLKFIYFDSITGEFVKESTAIGGQ